MRLLIVVSRAEPARYDYFRHVFGSPSLDVIVDRRLVDRRQRELPTWPQRRFGERRERDLDADLRKDGWALARCY